MKAQANQAAQRLARTPHHPSRAKPGNTARFWDRIAERYARKPVPNPEAYARKLTITRDFLSLESEVLELGCGTGSTALAHAHYVRHIQATDFSHEMLEIARLKAVSADIRNVEFCHANAQDALASGKEFDAILALNLLHLLADWRSTIEAAHKRLKAGGVFVSSTPCLLDEHGWLRWIASAGARAGVLPQLSFFTQEELQSAILGAGFTIEQRWQASSKNGLFLVARKAP